MHEFNVSHCLTKLLLLPVALAATVQMSVKWGLSRFYSFLAYSM